LEQNAPAELVAEKRKQAALRKELHGSGNTDNHIIKMLLVSDLQDGEYIRTLKKYNESRRKRENFHVSDIKKDPMIIPHLKLRVEGWIGTLFTKFECNFLKRNIIKTINSKPKFTT
jgi:hypothetical protein